MTQDKKLEVYSLAFVLSRYTGKIGHGCAARAVAQNTVSRRACHLGITLCCVYLEILNSLIVESDL